MIDTATESNDSPCERLVPDIARHIERVGDHFLDLLHAGQAPNRQEIVDAYRQLTTRLEQRLALIEFMFGGQTDMPERGDDRLMEHPR